ncbi:MAG: hypothetical protein IPK72_17350 [Candidatus Eisenbacteria bacterium]|nr:hypothetical protein [Candidatus Eisenbacteria bacterium]
MTERVESSVEQRAPGETRGTLRLPRVASETWAAVPDRRLLEALNHLVAREQEATAELLLCLAEVDARRLYLEEGCASLFSYCTTVLHLSEGAAYYRITAARGARRFPRLVELIASGALHLSGICLLLPLLDEANATRLLTAATHQSKREIEALVASERGRSAPAGPSVRAETRVSRDRTRHTESAQQCLAVSGEPAERAQATECAQATSSADPLEASTEPRSVVAPPFRRRADGSLEMRIGAHDSTADLFRRARDLCRHQNPSGDAETLLRAALSALIAQVERRRVGSSRKRTEAGPKRDAIVPAVGTSAAPAQEATRSRYIPVAVRRVVWERDGGQCAFVGRNGRRCDVGAFLEFHHHDPFARGGPPTVENLSLFCSAHNQHEGRRAFGPNRGGGAHRTSHTAQRTAELPPG